MYDNVAFPIIAILSWIKTQHFSKKILANYTSYRNILCTKRFVSLRGIFWYKPCLYTTYLLLGKCETCMKVLPFYFGSFYYRSKHSFHKILREGYVLQKHAMYQTIGLTLTNFWYKGFLCTRYILLTNWDWCMIMLPFPSWPSCHRQKPNTFHKILSEIYFVWRHDLYKKTCLANRLVQSMLL